MTATVTVLPPGSFACTWCNGALRFADGVDVYPPVCTFCGMNPHPGCTPDTTARAAPARARTGAARAKPLNPTPAGKPILGVDPGYRYTGVIVRDGDVVLHASTFVRPAGMDDPAVWALLVRARLIEFIAEYETATGVRLPMAVESVTAPKGFKAGKLAPLNPGPILFAGVVLGMVLGFWPDAVVIQPGGNGSQSIACYPASLIGRRPKDLPGQTAPAHTRDHEKSAYDVAGRAARVLYPTPPDRALLAGMRGSAA